MEGREEDRDDPQNGKAGIMEGCQEIAFNFAKLEAKVVSRDNLQKVRRLTESRKLPKMDSAEKLNGKEAISLNSLEAPCDMLGVEATVPKGEDTKANLPRLDTRKRHREGKGLETFLH